MTIHDIDLTSGEADAGRLRKVPRMRARDIEAVTLSNFDCGLRAQPTWSRNGVVRRSLAIAWELMGLAR